LTIRVKKEATETENTKRKTNEMTIKVRANYLLYIVAIASFFSCNENVILNQNLKIQSSNWDRNEKATFSFEVEDSLALYDIYLNLRHGGNYAYKNIYFFIETYSPDEKYAKDTAQMILANSKGRFMGKGIGDIFDYQFKFKEGVRFPNGGEYRIEIEQAMRENVLADITDIGVKIEKQKH